jgi:hypothetical protein
MTAGMSVEHTAVFKNIVIVCLICMMTVLAIALVVAGYPVDAAEHGLTPFAYWTILGLTFALGLGTLFVRISWKFRDRGNSPLFSEANGSQQQKRQAGGTH